MVMIPLDGGELSDQLLHRVMPLLRQEGDEAYIVRVADVQEDVPAVQQYIEGVQARLSGAHVANTGTVKIGDPATEVLKLAFDHMPALVVMATRGRTGPARWLLGSVAERVLRAAPVPVLLANPAAIADESLAPDGPFSFKRLLVPLDGSKDSEKVMPLVADVARRYGSAVTLLHVATAGSPTAEAETTERIARPLLEKAAAPLQGVVPEVELRLASGIAADCILTAVQTEQADAIAMTTHGRSGASRWLLGSVAEKVLRGSPVPVFAVRTAGAGTKTRGLLDTAL